MDAPPTAVVTRVMQVQPDEESSDDFQSPPKERSATLCVCRRGGTPLGSPSMSTICVQSQTARAGSNLGTELYDHRGDTGLWLDFPGEERNLVNDQEHKAVVAELHQKVLDYIQLR